ncbi:MAG TPA: agmatinase family protein [Candidatus Thermoplasmatota archaeon]|nr:agmatinase family protein [Candidatus Thermoplasmatota archaeon]
MERTSFVSTDHLWNARPQDPNDVFFAQVVEKGPRPARFALFGVPFDGAVLGRPGARAGPDAIRHEMAKLKPWTVARGAADISVADWGNVRIPHGSVAEAHQAIETAALEVVASGSIPMTLGGDHSITFPLVKAHEGRRSRIGVINLDAHLDVRDVVDGRLNSGQSFGRLLDLGIVQGANLVEVGIRDFANAPRYAEKAAKRGATVIGAEEWRERGIAAIDRAIEIAGDGTEGVYLSVDLDVLDQAHGPGVSAPTPGGVDSGTLLTAVRRIAKHAKLVGCDFVEVAPPLERDHLTARTAAWAAMTVLSA